MSRSPINFGEAITAHFDFDRRNERKIVHLFSYGNGFEEPDPVYHFDSDKDQDLETLEKARALINRAIETAIVYLTDLHDPALRRHVIRQLYERDEEVYKGFSDFRTFVLRSEIETYPDAVNVDIFAACKERLDRELGARVRAEEVAPWH